MICSGSEQLPRRRALLPDAGILLSSASRPSMRFFFQALLTSTDVTRFSTSLLNFEPSYAARNAQNITELLLRTAQYAMQSCSNGTGIDCRLRIAACSALRSYVKGTSPTLLESAFDTISPSASSLGIGHTWTTI